MLNAMNSIGKAIRVMRSNSSADNVVLLLHLFLFLPGHCPPLHVLVVSTERLQSDLTLSVRCITNICAVQNSANANITKHKDTIIYKSNAFM